MKGNVTNLKKCLGSTTVQNVSLYLKQLEVFERQVTITQFIGDIMLND